MSRTAKLFDVGDGRELTVAQIAEEAGVTVPGIHRRIASGLTGENLLRGKDVVAKVPITKDKLLGVMRPTPEGGWSDRELFNLRCGLSPVGATYEGKPPHPRFEDDGRPLDGMVWNGLANNNTGLPNNFENKDWRKLLDEVEASTTSLTQSVKKAFEPAPDQLVWPDED